MSKWDGKKGFALCCEGTELIVNILEIFKNGLLFNCKVLNDMVEDTALYQVHFQMGEWRFSV